MVDSTKAELVRVKILKKLLQHIRQPPDTGEVETVPLKEYDSPLTPFLKEKE